jgi:hypothetical protein
MRSFLENIGRFAKSPSRDQSRYGGYDARSQVGRLSTLHSLGTGVGVGGSPGSPTLDLWPPGYRMAVQL